MKDKAIELIVQQEKDLKSKVAEGYTLKRTIVLHGAHDVLTIKVSIEGEPKAVDKAIKTLQLSKLDNKCVVIFSLNPQTSLEDHL